MNHERIEHHLDALPFDAELDGLLDRLRGTHRFRGVTVPWTGGVDAGLARYYGPVYLQLVLPAHGAATVHRAELVDDRNAPSYLVKGAWQLFSGSRTEAAAFLLELVDDRHAVQDTVPNLEVR